MKYGVSLVLLGLIQIALALRAGALGWLVAWSGVSWLLAGCSYAFLGPKPFGKRADGTLAGGNVVLLLPFLLLTWLLWHLQIALTREPHHVEVVPGIWLGRRCYAHELPPNIRTVVDLTAEFAETKTVRAGRSYLCLPTLDASIPSQQAFGALIEDIIRCEAPVYIHCALGHGRSAMVAVAVLAAQGTSDTPEEAEKRLKQARSGIGINAAQRNLLNQWWAARHTPIPEQKGQEI